MDSKIGWRDESYGSNVEGATDVNGVLLLPRRTCGNADCAAGWTAPWRNRNRPIFEAQWGCSGRCLQGIVRGAMRRELGDAMAEAGRTPHKHRIPLGLVMLAQGWVTHPQLQKALELQRTSGTGRIGDWLVQECGLGAEHIARGLSVQWSCPVLDTHGFSAGAMALVMPKLFIDNFGPVPLRVAGKRMIYLGFEDRLDASVALAVERMTDLKVESGLVDAQQLGVARQELLAAAAVDTRVEALAGKDALVAKIAAVLEQHQPLNSKLVRLHQFYWLRLWLESGTKGAAGALPDTREDMVDYVFTVGAQS
jgi:hypothetical protein